MQPVKFEELYSGIKLWDSERNCWQKVLRTYLWKEILEKEPNRYYLKKTKKGVIHGQSKS